MTFHAHIMIGSQLHTSWRKSGHLTGVVKGVTFKYNGFRYEAATPLSANQAELLKPEISVIIEASGIAAPDPETIAILTPKDESS